MVNTGSFLKNIFITVLFAVFVFMFWFPPEEWWQLFRSSVAPCTEPIIYSIGEFDSEFGISKEIFLKAIKEAEEIWEVPVGRELFSYASDGNLVINLVYDYRQDTTRILQELGIKAEQSRTYYEELKSKYESTLFQIELEKNAFEERVAEFEARKKIYETDMRRANHPKRVSEEEYDKLNAEGDYLEREVSILNEIQFGLIKKITEINALAGVLNDLADALNLDVARYNEVGGILGDEFIQGVYESYGEGEGITIFQYDSYEKLVRVLAHELGHALSLEHIDDPDAIMYRLNEGDNETITPSDLDALKTLCGIK